MFRLLFDAVPAWRRLFPLPSLLLLSACSTTQSTSGSIQERSSTLSALPPPAGPEVRVVFHDGKAFAREGAREWPIAEVGRNEMLWAPDGLRFAYLKRAVSSAPISGLLPKASRQAKAEFGSPHALSLGPLHYQIVIRNIRGDSVNEFPVYRPGKPTELDWIDNSQLAYLAPPDASGDAYVIHSAQTGEVVQIYRGRGFTWSPGRTQLAYVTGKSLVRVGEQTVWPRKPSSGKPRRRIVGGLVWSPDGHSLAFMEAVGSKGNLVVLLVLDNQEGDLSWPLPQGALDPEHHIYWAESKVTIGRSAFQPRFAASWRRVR